MTQTLPLEYSVKFNTMNSVLVNTVTQVFKEDLVRTDVSKVMYLNIYDYAASQLQFFLTKAVDNKRDLNSYIDLKEYLESFTTSSNLKKHPKMIKNYRKVFRWFLKDVTFLRYKALIQNTSEHFLEFVPTIPNLMWKEPASQSLRQRNLKFDFKEDELKNLSSDFNCIVISENSVEDFLSKIENGEISVISFLTNVIDDRVPDIQEVVDFKEIALTLKEGTDQHKRKALATTVLYNYIYQVELHALIEYNREESIHERNS